MGAVTGDLNHKRGRVLGYESEEDMRVIARCSPGGTVPLCGRITLNHRRTGVIRMKFAR